MLGSIAIFILRASYAAASTQAQIDFTDTEARIDYAWFTEDTRALRTLIQDAGGSIQKGAGSAEVHYLLALAHYRLASLLAQARATAKATDVAGALDDCVDQAGKAAAVHGQLAEAYAMQSICYTQLAQLQSWKSVLNRPLGAMKMERALKLAPDSPRVALLDALRDELQPKGRDSNEILAKLRRALQLYEAALDAPVPSPGQQTPGWGYADAYVHLGRYLQERGDTVGARNAYERALIIAPEFMSARRELRQLLGN